MFDISFSEVLVIAAVALIVIGPERLPKVARTLGHLLGRAQRYVKDVKSDIQREMELEELRKWQSFGGGAARSVENTVRTEMNQFQETNQAEPKNPADEDSNRPRNHSGARTSSTTACYTGVNPLPQRWSLSQARHNPDTCVSCRTETFTRTLPGPFLPALLINHGGTKQRLSRRFPDADYRR